MIGADTDRTSSVLILDELDHISASAGSLTSLFTLAHANRHSLRVVGIANTHTLTAAGALFAGVPGVRTLHFAAYAAPALEAIVRARLAPLYAASGPAMAALLPQPALGLLARKVAAQTGDVRAAFEVLRGAIDAAVLAAPVTAAPAVTPAHVLSALKLYAPAAAAPTAAGASTSTGTSQLAAQVRTLGLQQRLVLLALVLAGQRAAAGLPLAGGAAPPLPKSPSKRAARAGAGGPDAGALHAFYAALLARAGGALSAPLPRGAFRDVLGLLETAGLVALPAPAPGRGAAKGAQDVRLAAGVRADEVLRGLGCVGAPVEGEDAREEEVRAICAQEQARVAREVRARAAAAGAVDAFAEASED
jgi:cell division control protein 6